MGGSLGGRAVAVKTLKEMAEDAVLRHVDEPESPLAWRLVASVEAALAAAIERAAVTAERMGEKDVAAAVRAGESPLYAVGSPVYVRCGHDGWAGPKTVESATLVAGVWVCRIEDRMVAERNLLASPQ